MADAKADDPTDTDIDPIEKINLVIEKGMPPLQPITQKENDSTNQTSANTNIEVTNNASNAWMENKLEDFKQSMVRMIETSLGGAIGLKRKLDRTDVVSLHAASDRSYDRDIYPQLSEENGGSSSASSVLFNAPTDNMSDLFPKSATTTISSKNSASNPEDSDCKNSEKRAKLDMVEEVLLQVNKELPLNEKFGPNIHESLAKRVVRQYNVESQSLDVRKAIAERHKLPENCKELIVPSLNKAVKGMYNFKGPTQRNERDLYNIQQSIMRANVAMIRLADDALKADQNSSILKTKDIVKSILDATTMLGYANQELNLRRKSNLKYLLAPEVRSVCTGKESSTQLLGDELGKTLKEARDISKIITNYSNKSPKYSSSTSTSSRRSSRTYDFLERGKNSHQSSRKPYGSSSTKSSKTTHKKGKN